VSDVPTQLDDEFGNRHSQLSSRDLDQCMTGRSVAQYT
jgi:hypothetical protein